jgi:hypothetical protein
VNGPGAGPADDAGPDPAGGHGRGGGEPLDAAARDRAALERRYRHWLAWYPAGYRKTYGDEMLGVLLAAAPAGRRHPEPAEAFSLAWSGSRARLGARGLRTDERWRDALAVYSLVAPVLLAAISYLEPWILKSLLWGAGGGGRRELRPLYWLDAAGLHLGHRAAGLVMALLTMAIPLVPVILGLLRLRRTAALAAALLLAWTTAAAVTGPQLQAPNIVALLVLLAVEVVALSGSAGPRRGLRLLSWRGLAMAIPWLAVVALGTAEGNEQQVHLGPYVQAVVIVAMLATLISARARRLLLLFAIPASPFAVVWRPWETQGLLYRAPVVLGLLALVLSRQESVVTRIARRARQIS